MRILQRSASIFSLLFPLILALFFTSFAYGKGGDLLAPFPVIDAKAGQQLARAMAVDPAGNLIVVGYSNTGVTGNDYHIAKFKSDGSGTAWAPVTYGGTGSDVATAVAVDSAGDIIVTGYTNNGADYDILTIKYSGADGSKLWEHTFDDGAANGNDYATAIAVDGGSDIYIGGYSANGAKRDDVLIIKYRQSGPVASAPEWVELLDDAAYPNNDNRISAIAAGAGTIAVTGYSSKSGADFDVFTRLYGFDRSFIREWRHSSAGSRDDRGVAVRIDSEGNIVVTGFITNPLNNTDIYVGKYDPGNPTPVWEATFDGSGNDESKGVWIDDDDDVYVVGYTSTLVGNQDFFTARYRGSDGTLIWKNVFDAGNGSTDIPVGVTVDPAADGGVFVTGYTTVSTDEDLLTIKYRKDTGKILWKAIWNGSEKRNDRPVGIALSARNVCVGAWSDGVSGYDFSALKYDFGPLNAPGDLTATAASGTSITLNWTDNASNEEKFVIQRKLGDGGTFTDIATVPAILPPDTTTYTDTGLAADNYYYYRVRAANAANGDSYYSNEARALTKVVSYNTSPWNYRFNSVDDREDKATAVTVGSDDHPVVTGYSEMTEEGVEDSFSLDYLTLKVDRSDKSLKWKARYDSGDGGNDMASGAVLDSTGDLLVTGTAYLSGGSDKSDDLYTIKFDTSGHTDPNTNPPFVWDHQYGTESGIDLAKAIAMAKNGSNSSVVVGYGRNGSNNDDLFVIKYNQDGSRPWGAVTIYDSGRHDVPTAVAFDPSGDIVVTGYSFDTSADPAGSYDWFTRKYSGADGTLLWTDTFDSGLGDDRALSLDIDTDGNVYATGYATRGGSLRDIHTIKYAGAAAPPQRRIWEMRCSGSGFDNWGAAVKVDPIDGNIVVAGTTYVSPTDSDFHVIRYLAADGSILWEKNFNRPGYDFLTAMTMDSSGHIYLAGNTRGGAGVEFDGTSDILSLIYDHEGTFLGAMLYDGSGRQDEAVSIAANYKGEAFVAGFSRNSTNADYILLKQINNYILVPAPFVVAPQPDYGKVDLGWRENTPGTSFRIERTEGPSNPLSVWTHVATEDSGTTGYTDSGLSPGASYCYRIDASIGSLNSRKLEKCVTTRLPAPTLDPPTVDSTTHISLSWNQVAGNTGYRIERKIGGGAWSEVATKAAGANSHTDTGLTPGTTHYYRVSTGSAAGFSAASNEQSAVTRPVAPVLNAPTGITNTQMVLGWNSVTGAASYTLQYKVSGGAYANFAGCTSIAGTTCTVTGLAAPNQYFFQVKAVNSGGDSSWSNETSGTAALGVPTLTTPVAAATITSTQMYVAWTNPVVTGANVTSYTLQYKEGAGGSYVDSGCPVGTNLFCTVADLTPNRTYYYRVRANNAAGSSNWSSEVSAKTLLSSPTLSSASGASGTQIDLVWTAVPEASGYTIQQSACTDSANPSTCRGVAASYAAWGNKATGVAATSYSATGLSAGTNYRYQIIATVAGNTSRASNVLHSWTNLPLPALTVTPASSTSLTLDWDARPGETGYAIETGPADTGPWSVIVAAHPMNNVSYTHSSLSLNTQYCYRVQAYSSEAGAPPSVYSEAKCKTTPPDAPVLAAPVVVSGTRVDLSWNNITGNTGYEIEQCVTSDHNQPVTHPLGGCSVLAPKVGADIAATSLTDLTAGYTYRYRVRGTYNVSDYTAWSNAHWVTTTPPAPVMTAPTAVSATTTQLTPTWSNVNGDNGYKLYWKVRSGADCTPGAWNGPIAQALNAVTYNHSGLEPGTFYCYQIVAAGPSGTPDSAASNAVFQTTKPTAPGQPTLSSITATSITVLWSNVTGNSGYNIERKTDASGTWSSVGTVAANVESFPNAGLTPGTLYFYRISANSAAGYSAASPEQSATTTPAVPVVTLSVISAAQIDLSWQVVPGATNYRMERKQGSGAYAALADQAVGYTTSYCGEPYPTVACPSLSPKVVGYQDAGLQESTTYCYRMRAWNSTGGDSAASVEKCGTTSALAVQNLVATAVNSQKVKLDWVPLSCLPEPCDDPDMYEIERLVRDGNWVLLGRTANGTTFTYTDTTGLEPNRRYSYRVRAVKGGDSSPYSSTATVSTAVFRAGDDTCQ